VSVQLSVKCVQVPRNRCSSAVIRRGSGRPPAPRQESEIGEETESIERAGLLRIPKPSSTLILLLQSFLPFPNQVFRYLRSLPCLTGSGRIGSRIDDGKPKGADLTDFTDNCRINLRPATCANPRCAANEKMKGLLLLKRPASASGSRPGHGANPAASAKSGQSEKPRFTSPGAPQFKKSSRCVQSPRSMRTPCPCSFPLSPSRSQGICCRSALISRSSEEASATSHSRRDRKAKFARSV
jgi:hypothetical protein